MSKKTISIAEMKRRVYARRKDIEVCTDPKDPRSPNHPDFWDDAFETLDKLEQSIRRDKDTIKKLEAEKEEPAEQEESEDPCDEDFMREIST